MDYSVKGNHQLKHVIIHKSPSDEVRKRGGVGKYGQMLWENFPTLLFAGAYANTCAAKGYHAKRCSHCL